jgi:hypothetical protein
MMMRYWLSALLLALSVGTASAQTKEPQVTGIYSNIYYNSAAGAHYGVELFVTYTREGYYVLFQEARGAPDVPILVKATVDQEKIEFVLPDRTGYHGKFSGTVSKEALSGSFSEPQLNRVTDTLLFTLRRTQSYWQ